MASFPTVPAFVHIGDWDETTRKHPATKAMEVFTNQYDNSNVLNHKWYASDPSYRNPNGLEFEGLDTIMEAIKQVYAPLISHYHEPQSTICIEADDGYKIYGQVKLFGNLAGAPAPGETKVKDRRGKEWDVVTPASYVNWYVKDDKAANGLGMAIKGGQAVADGSIVKRIMLKRGLISAEDL